MHFGGFKYNNPPPKRRTNKVKENNIWTKIDKNYIKTAIQSLNIKGEIVCIHSSLKSFGYVDGGAKSIIDAFLEEDCTILVFACTDDYAVPPAPGQKPNRNGWDYENFTGDTCGCNKIFTIDSNDITKEDMGVIPYEIVNMPCRKRGYNPLNSFVAIGKDADILVRGQSAENVWAPLHELYERCGYILLMGVDLNNATLIHYAEQVAGRNPFIRWANNFQGVVMPVAVGSCSNGFNNFSELLKPIETNITVGKSYWRCFSAKDMLDICVNAIRRNPEITHCQNPNCGRCNDAILGGPIS